MGLPRQPTVKTLDFDRDLEGVDRATIVFAQAGGATYQGVAVQGVLERNVAIDAAEVAPAGFEPAISALRGLRPSPLDDGANVLVGGIGVEPMTSRV